MKNFSLSFGISISRYIREHENRVRTALARPEPADLGVLLDDHLEKIAWMQHERLIHLLVTALFALLLMFVYGVLLATAFSIWTAALLVLVLVVLIAYVIHYFRLENSVQRWYRMADEIRAKITKE